MTDQPNTSTYGNPQDVPNSREFAKPKSVAVIIPCRNREQYLSRCLNSLLDNTYDKAFLKIVVVDGRSTDGTREIVQHCAEEYSFIRLLDNLKYVTPAALNIGIKATRSDVFCICGSHSVYPENFLTRLVEELDRYGADCVGGAVRASNGTTLLSKALGIAYTHPFATGNSHWRGGSKEVRTVRTVPYGCYRRDVIDRIGYFNEKLIRAPDREFNERLSSSGGTIILDPTVITTIFPRTSLLSYWKWNMMGAYWYFRAGHTSSSRIVSFRNIVPPIFFFWHLLPPLLYLASSWLSAIIVFPISLYWLVAVMFSSQIARRERNIQMFPLMVLIFAITHYGYGIGGFAGIVRSLLPEKRGKVL